MRLEEYVNMAIEELKDWIDDNPDCEELHDEIHEIADSSVPIYYYDIMQLGAANIDDLALPKPELGPAGDGTPTPVNIITANIYEYIEGKLQEYWQNHKKENP